jgi:hypothetical protein
MNLNSILPLIGIQKPNITIQSKEDYVGVISLCSTTVSDFYFGLLGGYNSIINCDKSSFINMRGTSIKMIKPQIVKITSSVI